MGAFCASTAPSASTGPVLVGQDGSQGGGPCVMSSWTAASSDCSRPVNNYVHVKTADLYRPNARLTPERQGYQVLTPFGKLGHSLGFDRCTNTHVSCPFLSGFSAALYAASATNSMSCRTITAYSLALPLSASLSRSSSRSPIPFSAYSRTRTWWYRAVLSSSGSPSISFPSA